MGSWVYAVEILPEIGFALAMSISWVGWMIVTMFNIALEYPFSRNSNADPLSMTQVRYISLFAAIVFTTFTALVALALTGRASLSSPNSPRRPKV